MARKFWFALEILILGGLLGGVVWGADVPEILKKTDTLSMSWREITSKSPAQVYIEVRVCAAEEGKKEMLSLPLGKFDSVTLSGRDKKIEPKAKSKPVSGEDFQKKVARLTQGMTKPVVRLELILKKHSEKMPIVEEDPLAPQESKEGETNDLNLAHSFVVLPDLSEHPKGDRKVLQEKVILKDEGFRARVLVEITRPE